MHIEWKKDCQCDSTARQPGFIFRQYNHEEIKEFKIEIDFYDGPVCNACDTPWRVISKGA
jgi:hypothetical protein